VLAGNLQAEQAREQIAEWKENHTKIFLEMLQMTQITNFGSRGVFLSIFSTSSLYKFSISLAMLYVLVPRDSLLPVKGLFQAVFWAAAEKILTLVLSNPNFLRYMSSPGVQFSNHVIFWTILCFTNSKNYLLVESEQGESCS